MDTPSASRWRKVEQLLDAALDLPQDKRAAFLDHSCSGDAELRREVERLLRACDTAEHFLEVPAPNFAAPLLVDTVIGLNDGVDAPESAAMNVRLREQLD